MLEYYAGAYVAIAVVAFFIRWRSYRNSPLNALVIAVVWPVWLFAEWVLYKCLGAVCELVGKAVVGALAIILAIFFS